MMRGKLFDECIIHIGTEKTGSKTLQRWLWNNRDVLLRGHNIFVPSSLTPYSDLSNHVRLTTYSMADDKTSELRVAAGVTDSASLDKHRKRVRQAFEQEIAKLPDGGLRLVLSNEHLQSRLTSDEELTSLREFLSPYCKTFKIVVFLRPQYEVSLSAYSQALRAGHFGIDPLPIFTNDGVPVRRWIARNFFDYENLLKRWERAFGYKQIKPILWKPDQKNAVEVCSAVAEVLGVDVRQTVMPDRLNEALSSDALEFLEWLNAAAPDSMTFRQRANIVTALQACAPGHQKLPQRSNVERFQQQFDGSNDRVRHRWFPGRSELFTIDVEALPETPESTPLSAADRARLTLRLLLAVMPAESGSRAEPAVAN